MNCNNVLDPIDTIEQNGLYRLSDIEYKGNFNINYRSKEELKLLQQFFGVRATKFDMKLLESRPALEQKLREFNYDKKNPDSRNSGSNNNIDDSTRKEHDSLTGLIKW